MGRPATIDEAKGKALIEAYGRLGSKAEAAREVGVSESAARRYFDDLPKAATPIIASQSEIIESAGASLFETRMALEENYRHLQTLSLQARANDMANPKAVAAAAIVLKEIRGHIDAAMKLYELMLRVDEVRKFQDAVLQAIGEVDEPTRQRIITILRDYRSVGLALHGGRD